MEGVQNKEEKNFSDLHNCEKDLSSRLGTLGSSTAIIKALMLEMKRRVVKKVDSMESRGSQRFPI